MAEVNIKINNYNQELAIYKRTLEQRVYRPPNGDVVVAAGAEAQIEEWDLLEPVLKEGFRFHDEETEQPVNPYLFPNVFDRAFWSIAEVLDRRNWPIHYTHSRQNQILLKEILPKKENEFYDNELLYKISVLNIMSNPVSRKKPFHALIAAFPEIFADGLSLLEAGSSARHILNALEIKYEPAASKIYKKNRRGHRYHDPAGTLAYNAIQSRHFPIGKGIGIDIWNWEKDENIRNWARTCTIMPSELMARPRSVRFLGRTALLSALQEYNLLDEVRSDNLGFVQLDISNPHLVDEYLANHPDKYDAIFIPTLMQQQTNEMRRAIFEQIEKFKINEQNESKKTFVILQDYCWPKPDNPHELVFAKDIYESNWLYHTLYKDPENLSAGWQVAFIHKNGRCNETEIGSGFIKINGKMVSIESRLVAGT